MRILLFFSLLAIYVSANSLPSWTNMKDEDILWNVLRGMPIDNDLWKKLEGIAWEIVIKANKDKWPQGPQEPNDGPAGLEQLKNEYAGYSEVEAPWREGRS